MEVQNKIVFVFNRFLIDFFKEIKKDNYFKVAIKKHYKVVSKKSPKYITFFKNKILKQGEILCKENLNIEELFNNEDFTKITIFKNIKIDRLARVYNEENDKKKLLSYLLILYLFVYLYEESISLFINDDESHDESDDDNVENVDNDNVENVDDDDLENVDDKNENDEEDNEEDNENDEEDNEIQLEKILVKVLKILNEIDMKNDIQNELSDILDDDVKNLLLNINKFKTTKINVDNNLDELIGNSKIGNLAKEISESINLDSLNLDNPEDLLNPANLFNSDTGNILGDLVQQVGSSITNKLSSGEIKQDELLSDAFSLMNRMQNSTSDNPILGDMMNNMMNNNSNQNSGEENDFSKMMQNMMNPEMMQQMMNSMGGTNAVNQNNPNSREGQAKERLKKKLEEKKKNT